MFSVQFFSCGKNTDRKIWLYLVERITCIVPYSTVNNSMNYHILYSILYCKQFFELSRTLQNCKQFSELSHTLQYCKQMNGLLQVDKVITELTKCLALNRILHGAGHWKLARSHANLAEAYLDLKGSSQALCFVIPNFLPES